MKKTKIRIGFSVVLLFFTAALGMRPLEYLAALTAALLHEMGHVWAAHRLGVPLRSFSVELLGARLDLAPGVITYRDELLIAAAGPAVNLTTALALYPLIPRFGGGTGLFIFALTAASLGLALLNLLPIVGFDGGRILYCLLSLFLSPAAAFRAGQLLSFFCVFSLWAASVYLLLKTAGGLAVFVFSASLFCRLFVSDQV